LKKIIFAFLIFTGIVSGQNQFTEINSFPGAFSRMGFGSRGMGMGNAMSAVITGNLVSYYNPALSVFQKGNAFQIGYSILSLDRSLNFLNFTKKFDFTKRQRSGKIGSRRHSAGISIGIINSGVSNIDGRDGSGKKLGDLSTSENQVFLSFSNRFSEKFALGAALKLYYFKLFRDITSTAFGLDVGVLYLINKRFTVSASISDINTKYKWDTGSIYGENGNFTTNKFPLLKKIGFSYHIAQPNLTAAFEFENSNASTNYIRFGIEYEIYSNLFVRSGLDKLNLSNFDAPVRPSVGFSYSYNSGSWTIGVDYAFVWEPYTVTNDQHILGLTFNLN